MNLNYSKIQAHNVNAPLKVVKGHFATNHAHTNYYIDLTTAKARISEAQEIAAALCQSYLYTMVVDTIVCMEGTEVIGAFLAQELKNTPGSAIIKASGFSSFNSLKYCSTPSKSSL